MVSENMPTYLRGYQLRCCFEPGSVRHPDTLIELGEDVTTLAPISNSSQTTATISILRTHFWRSSGTSLLDLY